MSEQVGASLVLAQMLLPTQSGTPNTAAMTDGAAAGEAADGTLSGTQGVDSVEINGPFSALLTELENLEARTPAVAGDRPFDAVINVQVHVEPSQPRTGTDLPATGNPLPEAGTALPEISPLLPPPSEAAEAAEAVAAVAAVAPAGNPLPAEPVGSRPEDGTIVVAEPITATSAPAAVPGTDRLQPAPSPLPLESASGTAPVSQQAAVPAPVVQEPAVRTPDVQTASVSSPIPGAADDASTAENSGGGQKHGEPGGERPSPANPSPRGPSITFSLDGLASPAMTSPASAGTPLSGVSQSASSQPLTLLGQPAQWAEPLAERLAGLATRGANTAEIRLHPPSLGQLEVRITLTNDQATLFVASANPEVREALQQALPRLDNLLNGLGIELADSEIAERQNERFQSDADSQQGGQSGRGGDSAESAGTERASDRLGLLDTWA